MKFYLLTVLLFFPAIVMCKDANMPTINDVKAQHQTRLLKLPGVVSVGIGQDENGKPAIIVGLEGPNPETQSKLPVELDGYSVRVRMVGRVKAQ
jgi:hypothetical protein